MNYNLIHIDLVMALIVLRGVGNLFIDGSRVRSHTMQRDLYEEMNTLGLGFFKEEDILTPNFIRFGSL